MRNTVSKRLRQAALTAPRKEPALPRELVVGDNSVINEPSTVRALYLRLKQFWKQTFSGDPKVQVERQRKSGSSWVAYDPSQPVARIMSPLKHLKAMFPPTRLPDGSIEAHPIAAQASYLASQGDGKSLQRLALAYL